MVEEQVGARKDTPRELPSWMKLFTAFKVALDPKKLLLAAAGIFVMAFGWWLFSALFFSLSPTPPKWDPDASDASTSVQERWNDFKLARNRWNLRYKMAGPVPSSIKEADEVARIDAADLAGSAEEYKAILTEKAHIESLIGKRLLPVAIIDTGDNKNFRLKPDQSLFSEAGKGVVLLDFTTTKGKEIEHLKKAMDRGEQKLRSENIVPLTKTEGAEPKSLWSVAGITVEATNPAKWQEFFNAYSKALNILDLKQSIAEMDPQKRAIAQKALSLLDPAQIRYKPSGQLRTWPWFEDRGPNPYLLLTGNITSVTQDGLRHVPWQRGEFVDWFATDQMPVLIEPLIKFLRPIAYLFDPGSGGLNRIYLFIIILWTLGTWAIFGGAITRMAAVQVARPNEKVGMTEAVRFARARFKSFLSAPLFPILFIVVLTVFLIVFGLFEWIPLVGDIFVAGLFWPLVLLVGLIMAVVLVGLIGWPLMYSTISTEGSDSFDAISRSYSYVYQAPWHYLWYSFVALVYGAVLVFFVGFMGSLMVYMGKWGVSQAPVSQNREPTYLFVNAPTSFGWRDLLLQGNPNAETVEVVRGSGVLGKSIVLNATYEGSITWYERIGGFLVQIWIYLVFLMVVGFGYSYFWTASTIIYLLMRRRVDDTEMDEVHLEEEEFEEPYPRAAATPAAPAPAAPAPAPATPARTMVESPTFRAPTAPTPAPVTAVAAPASPPAPSPIIAAPKTQLATEPPPVAPKTQLATEPPSAPKTQLAPDSLLEPKDGASAPPHEPTGNAEAKPTDHEGGTEPGKP